MESKEERDMPKSDWRDALFPLSDKARVIKLIIASYVGFLLVYLLGLRATSTISVSAIMTLPYGTTVNSTRVYARKRILAQLIGVAVAYPLYLFFEWAEFIPASQHLALPMTLSLIITAWINRRFKLKIPDITMLIPGYLVLLMTPGYYLYPLMRPINVVLGILIAYILNCWFLAPDYGKIVDRYLAQAADCLRPIMEGFEGKSLGEAELAALAKAEELAGHAEEALTHLNTDLKACKKYRADAARVPLLEQRITADRTAAAALRMATAADLPPVLRQYCHETLNELFRRHRDLFDGESGAGISFNFPAADDPDGIVVLAHLIAYMKALSCTVEVPCPESGVGL